MNKKYAFSFHYNKPASRAAGKTILTVHYRDKCYLVEDLECNVPTKVRHRKTQPYCVLAGKGILNITESKATIDDTVN